MGPGDGRRSGAADPPPTHRRYHGRCRPSFLSLILNLTQVVARLTWWLTFLLAAPTQPDSLTCPHNVPRTFTWPHSHCLHSHEVPHHCHRVRHGVSLALSALCWSAVWVQGGPRRRPRRSGPRGAADPPPHGRYHGRGLDRWGAQPPFRSPRGRTPLSNDDTFSESTRGPPLRAVARGPSLVKHGVATLVLRRFRFRLQYFHTARAPRANPSGKLVVLRTMEDGRTAFLLPFCCQSSKVSPPRRVSPTAHRPCMPLSCPASPPASRALRACFPVRPRLRVHRTVHSCARPGRHFPGSPDRHAGSPSATTHDITCAFEMRNSPNSSLALTHTGARPPTPTFRSTRG